MTNTDELKQAAEKVARMMGCEFDADGFFLMMESHTSEGYVKTITAAHLLTGNGMLEVKAWLNEQGYSVTAFCDSRAEYHVVRINGRLKMYRQVAGTEPEAVILAAAQIGESND